VTATKSCRISAFNLHKPTGQGYVRINGQFIYPGQCDLPETRQKYRQLISEWLANGCRR
jgi:hypothetical protein